LIAVKNPPGEAAFRLAGRLSHDLGHSCLSAGRPQKKKSPASIEWATTLFRKIESPSGMPIMTPPAPLSGSLAVIPVKLLFI
jgi:hypothetical protein